MTISVVRLQDGRISIFGRAGRQVVKLALSEDSCVVLAAALKAVAVNDPAGCKIMTETASHGAQIVPLGLAR